METKEIKDRWCIYGYHPTYKIGEIFEEIENGRGVKIREFEWEIGGYILESEYVIRFVDLEQAVRCFIRGFSLAGGDECFNPRNIWFSVKHSFPTYFNNQQGACCILLNTKKLYEYPLTFIK